MKRTILWTWSDGILSTFLSGLFAILPIAITVAIIGWVVRHLQDLLGPSSSVGRALQSVGLQFATDEMTAQVIGWTVVLMGIWFLGLLTKSAARSRIEGAMNAAVNHIPVVKGIYKTASQLVSMLRKGDQQDLKTMSVVFCTFGEQQGGGLLGLMASPEVFRFGEQDYRVVYLPTSPLPMTGGIIFVPADKVTTIDMSAEQMMRIYFSLGILAPQVLPIPHQVPNAASALQPNVPGSASPAPSPENEPVVMDTERS